MAVQVIGLLEIIHIDDKEAVIALQLTTQNAVDDPFGSLFRIDARHFICRSLALRFQFPAFFGVNIFTVGKHMHRVVKGRIENIRIDPHPEIIAAVFRHHKFILQIVIALVQLPQHVLAGKCIDIAVPELFFDLLFGYYQQKFFIRQILCAQSFEIQLSLFAGRFIFSNVQLIDIIVDLLRRFLKQLLPFFQQLRHPHVELSDHRSDSQNNQQDHHRNQNYRFQHLFIQLGQ